MNFCGWDWGCYALWLNSPTGAAWAQAIGAILAVLAAVVVARRQAQLAQALAKEQSELSRELAREQHQASMALLAKRFSWEQQRDEDRRNKEIGHAVACAKAIVDEMRIWADKLSTELDDPNWNQHVWHDMWQSFVVEGMHHGLVALLRIPLESLPQAKFLQSFLVAQKLYHSMVNDVNDYYRKGMMEENPAFAQSPITAMLSHLDELFEELEEWQAGDAEADQAKA